MASTDAMTTAWSASITQAITNATVPNATTTILRTLTSLAPSLAPSLVMTTVSSAGPDILMTTDAPGPDLEALVADVDVLKDSLTAFYLILNGALIWAMQIGFAFLEAGTIRKKNAVSSLTRMFMNGWISAISWWLVGYAFAFGTGNGFIGFNPRGKWALAEDPGTDYALWFFEYTFCAASAAIISGSVAEHATHHGFILYCFFFTAWIYPIGAHWEWGADGWLFLGQQYLTDATNPRAIEVLNEFANVTSYYFTANYQDFAGSGVVHIMGSFAGLAAMLITGPRHIMTKKFKNGERDKPPPHSLPLMTLGSMLLTFGFFAFNGGSELHLHLDGDASAMATAVSNTIISGAGGALSAILWRKIFGYCRVCDKSGDRRGKWSLEIAINGSLAGMVAICAGCNAYYPWASFVVGVIAGLQFILWVNLISKAGIDDPMDTFAVHGGAGTWGALAVALLKKNGGIAVIVTDELGTHGNCTVEGWTYFAWQLLGVVVIAAWAFVNMGIFLLILRGIDKLLDKGEVGFRLFRPTADDQETGLDKIENDEEAYHYDDEKPDVSNDVVISQPQYTRSRADSTATVMTSDNNWPSDYSETPVPARGQYGLFSSVVTVKPPDAGLV